MKLKCILIEKHIVERQPLEQIHLVEMSVCHILVLIVIKVISLSFSCPRNCDLWTAVKLKSENVNKIFNSTGTQQVFSYVSTILLALSSHLRYPDNYGVQKLRPHILDSYYF